LPPGEETIGSLARIVGAGALEEATVVAFDEGNFFSERLPYLCEDLVERGKRVIVAGLDMTFAGEPFGPMPTLLALADRVDKLEAVCVKCGQPATRSQRLVDGRPASADGPVIQVGGLGCYEARCRDCYER
jgi:thymidine kinase